MLKCFGAILIVAGSGTFGFLMICAHRREEKGLQQLLSALDYMQCELQYRLTPLPDLCRQTAEQNRNAVGQVLGILARELECQTSPNVDSAMEAALKNVPELPAKTGQALQCLGSTLGRFDVDGQIRGLEQIRAQSRREVEMLSSNREIRLRSYQTLGLCAGAALAILFV